MAECRLGEVASRKVKFNQVARNQEKPQNSQLLFGRSKGVYSAKSGYLCLKLHIQQLHIQQFRSYHIHTRPFSRFKRAAALEYAPEFVRKNFSRITLTRRS